MQLTPPYIYYLLSFVYPSIHVIRITTRYSCIKCSRLGVTKPGTQVQLLNILVRSTMEYGIEMWGPGYLSTQAAQHGNDAAEVFHRHFLRRLLGVRANTPNMVVYAELGKYPLRYHWRKRIYAYYRRLALLAAQGHRYIPRCPEDTHQGSLCRKDKACPG